MGDATDVHDPSVSDYADTSPTSLGRNLSARSGALPAKISATVSMAWNAAKAMKEEGSFAWMQQIAPMPPLRKMFAMALNSVSSRA